MSSSVLVSRVRPRSGASAGSTHTWLITAGVALALVDRVDLLRGAGPFILTPFLLVAPLLVWTAVVDRAKLGRVTPPAREKSAVVLLAVFLVACLGSLLVGRTSTSIARFVLLCALVASAWALIALVRRTGNVVAVRRGALIGLGIYVVLDLVQWRIFQQYGLFGPDFVYGVVSGRITPYGEGIARLSGGSLDANRAAVAIATYVYLLIADPWTKRPRVDARSYVILATGLLLTGLTLSRSGIAVMLLVLLGAIATMWRAQTRNQQLVTFLGGGALLVWLAQGYWIDLLGARGVISSRLSLDEGSASSHFSLFQRGLDRGLDSWRFFTGHGYGESYLQLQDVFPGSDYANYHSLYVTLLVEVGIVGLIAVTTLVVAPIFGPRRWLALGAAAFGVFYQGIADPVFWIQMAICWSLPTETPGSGVLEEGPLDSRSHV